ncbi:cell division protein ZipA [Vibrio paucivorans]
MQELRFVLIIVGALAIAALLFHGLWTSKKEGKAKFGDKPLGKLKVENDESQDTPQRAFAPEDDFEIIRKDRKEPDFGAGGEHAEVDPLIDGYEPERDIADEPAVASKEVTEELDVLPSFKAIEEPEVDTEVSSLVAEKSDAENVNIEPDVASDEDVQQTPTSAESPAEPEMEVIVLNVHCAGNDAFIGTKLFDSMQQNGLLYGEMDIFHRHSDLSGTGKVLFSVANMMQPGTLKHDDPAEFSTKGISFFMTLPCFGEADQNFKLMLKTAQQIADDLGGNVLDDARNLMTPDRLAKYRRQIQDFDNARKTA